MLEDKKQIILDEGLPIEVQNYDGTIICETRALFGRASTQNFETRLEHFRRMQFLPEVPVKNGNIIKNIMSGEYYLMVASMHEVIYEYNVAISAIVIACNATVKVEGIKEVGDSKGNIVKTPDLRVDNLKAYIVPCVSELKQYDPGLHPDADFRIYVPDCVFKILDTVTTVINDNIIKLKVVAVDYLSFPGVAILDVKTETRK